jgi:hypothetical protein
MKERNAYNMLLLPGTSPQRPAIHGPQDPFQVLIEKIGPLELTIGSVGSWVPNRVPDRHPTLYPFIITIPHFPRVYTGRHRLPMDFGCRKSVVQEFLQQRIRLP